VPAAVLHPRLVTSADSEQLRLRRAMLVVRVELEIIFGDAGNWSHTEQVSLKVIITFVLGFALAFAAGWYLSASLPHSGQ
jgi:hypothetical protein